MHHKIETGLADVRMEGGSPLRDHSGSVVILAKSQDLRTSGKLIYRFRFMGSGFDLIDSDDATVALGRAIEAELTRNGLEVVGSEVEEPAEVSIYPSLLEYSAEGYAEGLWGKTYATKVTAEIEARVGGEEGRSFKKTFSSTDSVEVNGPRGFKKVLLRSLEVCLGNIVKDFTWDEEFLSLLSRVDRASQ